MTNRQNKVHPSGDNASAQHHECADCGRRALLAIFRNEGLCNNCQIARDVEVVKRVAAGLAQQPTKPHDIPLPQETVIYCDSCARHVVAEQGQVCPYCAGGQR